MNRIRIAGAAIAGALVLTMTSGCMDKATEPLKDAPTGQRNGGTADVGSMPDGFSNYASKCDHGFRVFVVFHGDSAYGAITAVPDPKCPGYTAQPAG